MKVLIFILLLTILLSPVYAIQIDNFVTNEFKTKDKVAVIIKVKENTNLDSAIPNKDFIKKYRFSTINAFSGEITKEGLEKLKRNKNIERIEFDHPFYASLENSTI